MSAPQEDFMGFELTLYDDEIRTLHYAVTEAIKNWPGYPARPVEEQERLYTLRDGLYKMLLEMMFEATSDSE